MECICHWDVSHNSCSAQGSLLSSHPNSSALCRNSLQLYPVRRNLLQKAAEVIPGSGAESYFLPESSPQIHSIPSFEVKRESLERAWSQHLKPATLSLTQTAFCVGRILSVEFKPRGPRRTDGAETLWLRITRNSRRFEGWAPTKMLHQDTRDGNSPPQELSPGEKHNRTGTGRGREGSRLSLKTQAGGEMRTFYML